jgi:hypothetical protein
MSGKVLLLAAALLGGAVLALPAEAKRKPPEDPGATICELEWGASFGGIELKQHYSGGGSLTREDLTIRRTFPVSGGVQGSLSLTEYAQSGYRRTSIYLGLGRSTSHGKDQRLIFTLPGGEQLILPMEYGGLTIPIGDVDLQRLLDAKGPITYRMVKLDRAGREKSLLGEGWIDLSGFAGQALAGFPEITTRSRAVLTEARKGGDAPCARVEAAEMNFAGSDEPVRKWLTFDCGEGWYSALGAFELREKQFSWRPKPRDGATLQITGNLTPVPRADLQQFMTAPDTAGRYGQVFVSFGNKDWGGNFQPGDQAGQQSQTGEIRRGDFGTTKVLGPDGRSAFYWHEFAKLLFGSGDLEFIARNRITGASLRSVLPWRDVVGAEDELRAGQVRMEERERDPLRRCKWTVEADMGGEEIIVT